MTSKSRRVRTSGVSLVGLDLTPAVRLDQNVLLKGAVIAEFWNSVSSGECNPHPKTGALAGFRSQCMSRKEWTYSRAVKICNGCHRVLFSKTHIASQHNPKRQTEHQEGIQLSRRVTGAYVTRRVYLWLSLAEEKHSRTCSSRLKERAQRSRKLVAFENVTKTFLAFQMRAQMTKSPSDVPRRDWGFL